MAFRKKSDAGAGAYAGSAIKIEIPEIKKERMVVWLSGDTRLVTNKFSNKALYQMLCAQKGIKLARENREPAKDFGRSLHHLAAGKNGQPRFGFPVTGIKEAMATAGSRFFKLDKVAVYGLVYLVGEQSIPDQVNDPDFPEHDVRFSPIDCAEVLAEPVMRTDMVRNSGIGRTADLRFRGSFEVTDDFSWKVKLLIVYQPTRISPVTIVNLLEHAGQMVGIGEYRVEKGGEWGRFHVEPSEPVAAKKSRVA